MNVTVIIATYNRNKILCDTLQLLMDQKGVEFELLVVDQSKTHDQQTTEFLTNNASRFKYIKLPVGNLPAARNVGLRNSTGELCIFLDDDVSFNESLVKDLKEIFEKNPEAAGVTGLSRSINLPEGAEWNVIAAQYREQAKKEPKSLYPMNYLPGFFMAYRRSAIEKAGGFDEWIGAQFTALHEDGEMCLRLRLHGFKLFVAPSLYLLHLVEPSGGCEVRTNFKSDSDKLRYHQVRNTVYGVFKNRAYLSAKDFLLENMKCLRLYLSLYNFKTRLMPRLIANYFKMIREVRAELALNQIVA